MMYSKLKGIKPCPVVGSDRLCRLQESEASDSKQRVLLRRALAARSGPIDLRST
jgi:hypothetical protein